MLTSKIKTYVIPALVFVSLWAAFYTGPYAVVSANAHTPAPVRSLSLQAKSAILLEVETGQILYQANADIAYPPASMSKMMTEYIVLSEIKGGRLNWEDQVAVSKRAQDTVGSKVFLAEGDTHTVRELFTAKAVGSANDASIALAEHIAGSEEAFAMRMNVTAKELQLTNAHFINATGLGRGDMSEEYRPTEIEGETVMSARDAAYLALAIQREHPDFFEISSLPSYQFKARDAQPIINYNWMLEGNSSITSLKNYAYEGLDGMKTGYTDQAGYCFTGTAERNGMRLISVVMGTASESMRFVQTRKLLDYGFGQFERKTILAERTVLEGLETVKVFKAKEKEVGLETEEDLTLMTIKGTNPKLTITAEFVDEIVRTAPIPDGTVLGKATITYIDETGQEIKSEMNLLSKNQVDKASWFTLILRSIGNFFNNLKDSLMNLF
ncbi:D-alanyl-D-alanine carboxypeptidase [Paenibacillus sp. VTT E-133280]|uniref:D-alanyl-D-alanine carboxypeptidase family protein n=1 Tax=unclassified Paenibacillus TaxID=185978 RepID=UPI000BA01ADF|nr:MULTISPECIES: D-alanyl-D-alanine carboxypeptidase family protein [unclassified Paenibacillus]MBY3621300.1 D-alanyl-D-alanine carboxypeptidase [Acinetobacter sp. CUI P1]MDH6373107.1 D-alanyl-D-alanine carboxypeptidase (penicillin-binding protein 5/6) [Paenibacillus sp. PastF-3]OZQ69023.1 D-alanyl-D-alanine carboxypeptidase [Paenibacillus sp. VTT E-133280]OZQ97535.1 D-alanyl-D-alanine carboxypeptidase [Paenibacillus sp. VTT E-133291]